METPHEACSAEASLATSSGVIPTDSQAAAPYWHPSVLTLSTVVMRFDAFSTPRWPPRRQIRALELNHRTVQVGLRGLTLRQRGEETVSIGHCRAPSS